MAMPKVRAYRDVPPVHAHEVQGPVEAVMGHEAERGAQEACEPGRVHLARRHGELAVLHRAEAADVARYGDVVGRVGEGHGGALRLPSPPRPLP